MVVAKWAFKVALAIVLGVAMGVLFGLLGCLVTKFLDMREMKYQYQEVGLVCILPFFCYWVCQCINVAQHEVRVSSPIAICVTGIIMGNVAWKNMSEAGRSC